MQGRYDIGGTCEKMEHLVPCRRYRFPPIPPPWPVIHAVDAETTMRAPFLVLTFCCTRNKGLGRQTRTGTQATSEQRFIEIEIYLRRERGLVIINEP